MYIIGNNVAGVFQWGYLVCRKPTHCLFRHVGFWRDNLGLLGFSAIDVIRERYPLFNFLIGNLAYSAVGQM